MKTEQTTFVKPGSFSQLVGQDIPCLQIFELHETGSSTDETWSPCNIHASIILLHYYLPPAAKDRGREIIKCLLSVLASVCHVFA